MSLENTRITDSAIETTIVESLNGPLEVTIYPDNKHLQDPLEHLLKGMRTLSPTLTLVEKAKALLQNLGILQKGLERIFRKYFLENKPSITIAEKQFVVFEYGLNQDMKSPNHDRVLTTNDIGLFVCRRGEISLTMDLGKCMFMGMETDEGFVCIHTIPENMKPEYLQKLFESFKIKQDKKYNLLVAGGIGSIQSKIATGFSTTDSFYRNLNSFLKSYENIKLSVLMEPKEKSSSMSVVVAPDLRKILILSNKK